MTRSASRRAATHAALNLRPPSIVSRSEGLKREAQNRLDEEESLEHEARCRAVDARFSAERERRWLNSGKAAGFARWQSAHNFYR
jgi:hypothetical protein